MIGRRIRKSVNGLFNVSSRSKRLSSVGRAARSGSRPEATGKQSKRIRYAVVGLGHIAQAAVLPGFGHASRNSELAALVSGDPVKLRELSRRYRVPVQASYEEYGALLRSGKIDAVYIAEPNSLHRDFTLRAADAGIHVLCEKPLAVSEAECKRMIAACRHNGVKLMTAYRLHFEKANLEAIRLIQSGKIGEPRFFNSIFSMQARSGNIRLRKKMGGGPLFDLGVYCINAARYLFRAEPVEVEGLAVSGDDKRFREVEEMAGAILRFPGERLATFICSFGAADSDEYQILGTKGSLCLRNAYEYAMPIELVVTINGKTQTRVFKKRDQFAPELLYFSDCVLRNKEPEPSGVEGLNDVRVIQAIFDSAKSRSVVKLRSRGKNSRPTIRQEIRRPALKKPKLVRTKSGSKD
jgi:predicted dehydrogenase